MYLLQKYEVKSVLFREIVKSIIIFTIIIMLFACENDIKEITSLSQVDSLTYEQARDIVVYYSDSGRLKACLESPLMKSYEKPKAYIEFPEGFKVIFYDSALKPRSEITAKYGIRFEKTKIMEAKNNVVVKNIDKNEQLNTEHLIWDENKGIIYSEVFVKITRADEVLYGDGLNSDQNFENYTIKNPTGEFKINPDEQ
jgi:LPS export ABC transporter protein LptC